MIAGTVCPEVLDAYLTNLRDHYESLSFPPPHLDPRAIEKKLKEATPENLWTVMCEAAEALGLPTKIVHVDDRPFATPGVFGGLVYRTDCLLQDDSEASGRIQGVAASCWGASHDGLIPVKGEISRGAAEAFNPDALSFSLGSFLARHRLSQEATGNRVAPHLWIGNAAVRDEKHPTGVEFYLAHLKGDVIAISSGLRGLSDVAGDIIGLPWRINIREVIDRFSNHVDTNTHFRSQFLDAAAYLWAKGEDVLAEPISLLDIPPPPSLIIEGDKVITQVAHGDAFDNLKLRLRTSQLAVLGWVPGDRFNITINGMTEEVILNGAISEGDKNTLIMTEGSTWHGVPSKEGVVDPFMDIFWNKLPARERFRDFPITKNQVGLPQSGDEVEILKIS